MHAGTDRDVRLSFMEKERNMGGATMKEGRIRMTAVSGKTICMTSTS